MYFGTTINDPGMGVNWEKKNISEALLQEEGSRWIKIPLIFVKITIALSFDKGHMFIHTKSINMTLGQGHWHQEYWWKHDV